MKQLNLYINEKLVINKDIKSPYKYYPKTWHELREILKEILAKDKNADLNDIDVSEVNSFFDYNTETGLFENLDPHNIKIDEWDVSKVTNMSAMFFRCENFNCDLSNWDVHNVETMNYMFYVCKNFNCDLSKWDVSKVINMSYMFNGCHKFEGIGLENWKVKNCFMHLMFDACDSLKNKPSWYKE